ncbi:MAG: LuxR C-terminal-related transcriptional regulator [Burkholderiales bacterium]
MPDPALILKTTPPRASRAALPRERMTQLWAELRDRTAISIAAPAGFGKTTLLVQWRRLWMESGAIVAWVTLDDQDDPARFAEVLLYAMRAASGRASFDRLMQEHAGTESHGFDTLTGLLAEIAALASPTVLMLDDAERLPDETLRGSLAYLLMNAPPNLHVVVGTRGPLKVPTAELDAHGQLGMLRGEDLRLELFESVSVLEKRFGQRLTLDDCVRLHEATEGWPLGLQLAATAIERSPDPREAAARLSARQGDLERYFFESSFSRLAPELAEFLVRIAILDDLTPELCEAVTCCAHAAAYLDRLAAGSPVIVVGEMRDWMRIHGLARDFLLGRFEKLPEDEQGALHRRAGDWLARHGRFHEAGRHALAAGDQGLARDYAKRCLFDLAAAGKVREARAWLEQLPDDALAGDDDLRLIAAWIDALGARPRRALEIAEQVHASADATAERRFLCALVATCAAGYLDRPGIYRRWMQTVTSPPAQFASPVHAAAWANACAFGELHGGGTEHVRRLEAPFTSLPANESLSTALALGRVIVALSHLWDGDTFRTDAVLRPALIAAERQAGRRSVLAATYAAPLAAAIYLQGDVAGARALLANRLDVVEQTSIPDSVTLAYRVIAHVALVRGDERTALETLANLHEFARAREMPRIALISLADQVRIHAHRSRVETAHALLGTMDALAPSFAEPDFAPYRPLYDAFLAISRAYVALARLDLDATERHLGEAEAISAGLRHSPHALTVKILRAVVAHERGLDGTPLLREVMGLVEIGGARRLVPDTHPLAARMAAEIERKAAMPAATAEVYTLPAAPKRSAPAPGGLLTPKEAEVLRLLEGGMSNKMIAKTMDISDETVKWHLKNLFSKLNAGTRRHAVDRARLLGLIVA